MRPVRALIVIVAVLLATLPAWPAIAAQPTGAKAEQSAGRWQRGYDDARPIPGDRWNGMAVRMAQARSLNKPLIVGEAGIRAGASGCMTPAARRDAVNAKVDAQFRGGTQALVVWAQVFGGRTGCSYEFEADDPLLDLVRSRAPRR